MNKQDGFLRSLLLKGDTATILGKPTRYKSSLKTNDLIQISKFWKNVVLFRPMFLLFNLVEATSRYLRNEKNSGASLI